MIEDALEFEFRGPEAEADARELAKLLRDELPDWPTQAQPVATRRSGDRDVPTALAVTALVVAIPGSVLATWTLVERMKLKAKLQRLIDWAKERRARGLGNPRLTLPNAEAIPLDEAKPEQLLDVVEVHAKRRQRK